MFIFYKKQKLIKIEEVVYIKIDSDNDIKFNFKNGETAYWHFNKKSKAKKAMKVLKKKHGKELIDDIKKFNEI